MVFKRIMAITLLLVAACKPESEIHTLPLADGWNGGDAAYSKILPNGERLWLFGDSFVGPVQEGQRIENHMYRNAAAIQSDEAIRYYWGKTEQGLIPNTRSGEWYWPADFGEHKGTLYLFMRRMALLENAGKEDPFGFRRTGNDVIVVRNPQAAPDKWKTERLDAGFEDLMLGVAAAIQGNYLYLLSDNETETHGLHLSRLPLIELAEGDYPRMEFYDKVTKRWASTIPPEPFFANGSPEASLVFDASRDKWRIVISAVGFSPDIQVLESESADITGGWGKAKRVFACPEVKKNDQHFCYAGKEVPGLAEGQNITVTYSVNSFNFEDLEEDASLYIPRLVTVSLP